MCSDGWEVEGEPDGVCPECGNDTPELLKMILAKITYSDGTTLEKEFNNQQDASWHVYTEGDHVVAVEYLSVESS